MWCGTLDSVSRCPEVGFSGRGKRGGSKEQGDLRTTELIQSIEGRTEGGAVQHKVAFVQHNPIKLTDRTKPVEEVAKGGRHGAFRGDKDDIGPVGRLMGVPHPTRDGELTTASYEVRMEADERDDDDGGPIHLVRRG